MNIKKLVLPLLALLAGSFAFAQQDGPEPDWDNPDETGTVFVCFEARSTKDGAECVKGTWFTVDQLPDGNDGFKADPAQVAVLTELYNKYPEMYKEATYIKPGEFLVLGYKNMVMFPVSHDAELETEYVGTVRVEKVDTEYGSFLTVLPTSDGLMKTFVSMKEENGQIELECDAVTATVIK